MPLDGQVQFYQQYHRRDESFLGSTPQTLFQVPPPQRVLQPVMMNSAKRDRDTLEADTPFGPTSLSRIPQSSVESSPRRSFYDRQGASLPASSRIPMPATAIPSTIEQADNDHYESVSNLNSKRQEISAYMLPETSETKKDVASSEGSAVQPGDAKEVFEEHRLESNMTS